MEEEAAPIRKVTAVKDDAVRLGLKGSLQLPTAEDATLALVTTGIGLTNAVSSLTTALSYVSPRYVSPCDSAGDSSTKVAVGEVTASSDCVYGCADVHEFGYELGQAPGMPVSYVADGDLLSRFTALSAWLGHITTRAGRSLPSDCFVNAELAVEFRKLFPSAITADMESMALVQIAAGVEVPFLAIRGISGLCGPKAAVGNYQYAPEASRPSFLVALYLIEPHEPEEIA